MQNARGHHLCAACKGIDIERLQQPEGYFFHASIAALETSAENCALCKLIRRAARAHVSLNTVYLSARLNDYYLVLRYVWKEPPAMFVEAVPQGESNVVAPELTHARRNELGVAKIYFPRQGVISTSVDLKTEEGDPAVPLEVPWWRTLPNSTRSHESLALAKQWLQGCLTEHVAPGIDRRRPDVPKPSRCPELSPKRLIELHWVDSSPTDIRLVETKALPSSVKYLTLSYSWGKGPWPWRTLSSNSVERQQRFSRKHMPGTIYDAIVFAERLGHQYLWIDALCIKQDDDADWAGEAAKMGEIYNQSLLTLAASSSTSSRDGLFNSRSENQLERLEVCIPIANTLSTGEKSTLYFHTPRGDIEDSMWYREVEYGPLSQRGWVCQEKVLSPRTLCFTRKQLFWQCQHCILAEDNLRVHPHIPASEYQSWWRDVFFDIDLNARYEGAVEYDNSVDNDGVAGLGATWYSNVVAKSYSYRQLTQAKDKLVAVSGLASVMNQRYRSDYLAGLWRDALLPGLTWIAEGSGSKRLESYQAPSWSWANLEGRVDYGTLSAPNAVFDCQVLAAETTKVDANAYGQVSSGFLDLEAAVLEAKLARGPPEDDYIWPDNIASYAKLDNGAKGLAWTDLADQKNAGVLALLLRQDFIGFYLLLVVPVGPTKQEYQRVGMARFSQQRSADDVVPDVDGAERRIFRIV